MFNDMRVGATCCSMGAAGRQATEKHAPPSTLAAFYGTALWYQMKVLQLYASDFQILWLVSVLSELFFFPLLCQASPNCSVGTHDGNKSN